MKLKILLILVVKSMIPYSQSLKTKVLGTKKVLLSYERIRESSIYYF